MTKTVLITGASRGIGRATAMLFARAGFQVAINYLRNKQAAVSLLTEINEMGADAFVFRADVSDRAQVDKMVKDATAKMGHIDVLINNAGIAQQKMFTDLTHSDWERMFAVNVNGVFHTCQSVLPQMIFRKSGKIINVSSMWGITGASCEVHYSAAKAAILGFTKALAKEMGPSNIQVNCIAPGVISTDMNVDLEDSTMRGLREQTPLERIGTPDDVSGLLFFLASERASFITGQVISVNGGLVI